MMQRVPLSLGLPVGAWVLLYALGSLDAFSVSATFAILVAFPLALSLDEDVPAWLGKLAATAGLVSVASFFLDAGIPAAILASAWMPVAIGHAAFASLRFLSANHRTPHAWAEAMAGAGPLVGATALVTSRLNGTFFGFDEPFATLTVTHFHFTFGLLPLALSALARKRWAAVLPLWGFVFVPPVIGALFATRTQLYVPSPAEGAAVCVLAMVVFAWSMASPTMGAKAPPWALSTIRFAGLGLLIAILVAAIFSVSLAFGHPKFDYRQVLATHGIANAVSTVALGFVAWSQARFRGISEVVPVADMAASTRDIAPQRALFRDSREFDLGPAANERFERLSTALLAYEFYPNNVMISSAAFKSEGRAARVGDRIGMCLFVPLIPGFPAARFPATTEVNVAECGTDHAAFGYLTTTSHYGKGAWSARIERRGDRAVLLLQSRMTPTHPLALAGLPLYRWFQKRAHAAGAARLAAIG